MHVDADTRASDEGGTAPAPLVRRLRDRISRYPTAWRQAVVAAIVLRLLVAIGSFAFGGLLTDLDPVDVEAVVGTDFSGWEADGSQTQGSGLLGAGLERFDALWYLAIAEQGYPTLTATGDVPGAAAFFPGFPLLVGMLGRLLLGRFYLAGSLVALGATIVALAGIHRLVSEETGDERLASRAVVVTAVFPSAFFLVAPYTESLFLALSVWALVWAHRRGWLWAALLAAGAGLTRNVGVLMVVPLLLEAWRQHREGDTPGLRAWAAALGAPVGGSLYLVFSWLWFGTPWGPIEAQVTWEREWTFPTAAMADAVRFGTDTPGLYPSGYHTLDLLVFVPVIAAVAWLLWRTPLPYGTYAAAHVLVWLVYPFPGRPLMSTYRFAIAIAPIAWAFAAWTRRRGVATTWYATSGAVLGVMLMLFTNWYYVF
ncbi:MAG: hypothetical protein KY437_06125 [Actinobacteria bacterium]|nr:hypothetical protein [Actinomycetota bacterium]